MSDATTVRPHLMRWFESRRVVFWHDPEGQYATDLDSLDLPGIQTIHVANDEFAIKNRLLHDEPEGKFLVVRVQNQVALIRETGSSFEETVYPSLLDELAASQQGDDDGDGGTPPPPKQTVSVKTISATGISGVLETEPDVDRYLRALRIALVKTVNDGKRISL